MITRYGRQVAYVLLLGVFAGACLTHALAVETPLPGPFVAVFCVGAGLFVFHLGMPVPAIGLVSLERVTQVGMLLVFEPGTAAALNAIASLIWPFTNRRYSQGSLKVATLRGVHNAAMTATMVLLAGSAYRLSGGQHPLQALAASDIAPLILLALTLQLVNITMMAVFFWLDGRDVRRLFTPLYVLSDLLFVPAGVLAALIYNAGPPQSFTLFVVLLVVFTASFNASMRSNSTSADTLTVPSKADAGRLEQRGAHRVDALANRLLEQCHTLFHFGEFYFALYDKERGELDVRLHERCGQRQPRRSQPAATGVFGWVLEHRKPLLVEDWRRVPADLAACIDAADRTSSSIMVVPLGAAEHPIGLLSIQAQNKTRFVPADLDVMQRLADSAAAAVADARAYEELDDYKLGLEQRVAERTTELEQANTEKGVLLDQLREKSLLLERQSREDPLTGLANRREFDEGVTRELLRAERNGDALALAMLDLDHFKLINDRMGHAVGDAVLREVAVAMRRQCRAIDLIARYGGEEFALVLPDTGAVAAVDVCERVRRAVELTDWSPVHQELRVTLSAGVAEWKLGISGVQLLAAADRCLYEAKRTGRNRVCGNASDPITDPI